MGYDSIGSPSSRVVRQNDHFPPEKGEAMTAVGLCAASSSARIPDDDKIMGKHAELLKATLPE